MLENGWEKIDDLREGAVLHWEEAKRGDDINEHVGFYIGNDEAISNSSDAKTPIRHHITYGTNPDGTPVRKVIGIYWNKKLEE